MCARINYGGEPLSSLSLGVSADYSGSALRFGLMDIKPIEVVETIKRFGVKFKRIARTFETLKPSESFEDLVTFENEAVFAKIDIPHWFEAAKLVKLYSQRSIDRYEKDTDLQRAIENMKESKRIGRPLLSFVRFMTNRFESKREDFLEAEADNFLHSNFPLSFYNKFVVLGNTYGDFLKVLEQIVRIHEFRASSARNFKMYGRHISEMKRRIGPIIDQLDVCSFAALCLRRYVTLWNAKSYEQIWEEKFLDKNNIDVAKFEQLYSDFKMKLTETRRFLLEYDPRVLHKELALENDPTAQMFGKLVTLPSSSLSLER